MRNSPPCVTLVSRWLDIVWIINKFNSGGQETGKFTLSAWNWVETKVSARLGVYLRLQALFRSIYKPSAEIGPCSQNGPIYSLLTLCPTRRTAANPANVKNPITRNKDCPPMLDSNKPPMNPPKAAPTPITAVLKRP